MTDKEILAKFNQKKKIEYKKDLVRPKFTLYKELASVVVFFLIIGASIFFQSELSKSVFVIIISIEIVAFLLTQTKYILLLLIFMYQKFASATIRKACLFTPSCSEYMRLSILKYGVLKGVKKGFKRLRSCRPPNGGIDEP